MLGLGNNISASSGSFSEWGSTRFLSFDGVDDKAEYSVDQSFITAVAGEGDIGANIAVSFWVKPTWDSSGTLGTTGFAPRQIKFFYLGSATDNHESVQGYYQLTNSSGNTQNRLWSEVRATTSSNTRDSDYSVLHSNNGVTGTGTGSSDHWKTDNPADEAWVHILMTRATGNWTQYWNGNALSMADNDSGTLNTDNSISRIMRFGGHNPSGQFYQYGIRDFAIFTKQLDGDDATTLYNSGSFFDVRESGISNLGLYYPFNGDGVDIIGGHNLTLTGGTFTAL